MKEDKYSWYHLNMWINEKHDFWFSDSHNITSYFEMFCVGTGEKRGHGKTGDLISLNGWLILSQ